MLACWMLGFRAAAAIKGFFTSACSALCSQRDAVPEAMAVTGFVTPFNGCSVEFSPFLENRLAVATAQYYGIIGNGRQHVLDLSADGQVVEVRYFDTQDGLYDCSWNESNENQLVSASADGSIKLFDLNARDVRSPTGMSTHKKHRVWIGTWRARTRLCLHLGTRQRNCGAQKHRALCAPSQNISTACTTPYQPVPRHRS